MKRQSGQTLIEILAALSVVVVVLTGITMAVLNALNNTTDSKNDNLATAFAQQGMESMKSLELSDYTTFKSLPGQSYCLAQTCNILTSSDPACWLQSGNSSACKNNVNNFFTRVITVPSSAPDCASGTIEVQSIVSWANGKCTGGTQCKIVQVTSCFSKTSALPTP